MIREHDILTMSLGTVSAIFLIFNRVIGTGYVLLVAKKKPSNLYPLAAFLQRPVSFFAHLEVWASFF
jgi:hypothetical protein